MLLPR